MEVQFGPFVLDVVQRRLTRNGSEIHLTPMAFNLLALLVAEAPRVVPKQELHERLWPRTFVSEATLLGLVKELRRALDDREARDHPHGEPRRLRFWRGRQPGGAGGEAQRPGRALAAPPRPPDAAPAWHEHDRS